MAQGVLPFQLSGEFSKSGVTALAGLPTYLELGHVLDLGKSIERHVKVRAGAQGYTDVQFILPLILLNLAGGDCVADLDRLEEDPGFRRVFEGIELRHLSRKERRKLRKRWRKKRERLVPSASSFFRYLSAFSIDDEEKRKRGYGQAFIPEPSQGLLGLESVNRQLIAAIQRKVPETHATLDIDATLKETQKRDALVSYKGFAAYQPLQVWWDEAELIVKSEFRDGNVPANFENLRVLREALRSLPEGVRSVSVRSDAAAYQRELLKYLAEGRDERFGKIHFAISAPLETALKTEVAALEEDDWQPLLIQDKKTGEWKKSAYEWAEVVFVPNWVGRKKSSPEYRYIATREVLCQGLLPGTEEQVQFDFPVAQLNGTHYRLHALVTNLDWKGDEIVRWSRKRCGKAEQVHSTMKTDLAGSQFPSGDFGVNAAWWAIMILALNLNSAMKRLVLAPALGKNWGKKRLKAIRYHIINLPGRVVNHARELWIKIGGVAALRRLCEIRKRILALA